MLENQLYPIHDEVLVSIKDIQALSFKNGELTIILQNNTQKCECTEDQYTALLQAIDQVRPFFVKYPSQLCNSH